MIKYKLNSEIVFLDFKKHENSQYMQTYFFDLYSEDKKLLVECWTQFHSENNDFEIKTITAMTSNNGYGSFIMKKVIELALELKADSIRGFISAADVGTEEEKRQVHGFYKKHFAEIRGSHFNIDLKNNANILELLEIQHLKKIIAKLEEEKQSILEDNKKLSETTKSLLKKKGSEKKITTIFKKIVNDKS